MLREELKIRCTKEFFWRHARCLESWWNFVSSARINSSMQTKTKKNNREVTLRSTCPDKFRIAVTVVLSLVKVWQLLKQLRNFEVTVQQRFISNSEIQTDIKKRHTLGKGLYVSALTIFKWNYRHRKPRAGSRYCHLVLLYSAQAGKTNITSVCQSKSFTPFDKAVALDSFHCFRYRRVHQRNTQL